MLVLALLAISGLLIAGCTTPSGGNQSQNATIGVLYSQGVGPMPNLLATKQIDGYIAWQPFVSIANQSRIGQVVEYSQNLPPSGMWTNHPCCVITARDDLLAANPDFVNAISAITILGDTYITEHPDETADILADWLVGRANFTYGNVSVGSVEVMHDAIRTVRYTTEPSDTWINGTRQFVVAQKDLGIVNGRLANATGQQLDELLFDFGPYESASQMIAQKKIVTPPRMQTPVTLGYLKADMHSGGLLVAIKKYQWMNDNYGVMLKPRDPSQSKPEVCDLVVNGETVAEVRLVSANAGPELMQMAATNNVQMGFAGVPPAIAAIDKGTPIKVLHPINTEGSGLVATAGSPAKDWNSFAAWAKTRATEGKPLKIAAPSKGSIQDVMLRYSLKHAGFTITEGS
jgi:NitT/TauT family transport system substrate-binding protein